MSDGTEEISVPSYQNLLKARSTNKSFLIKALTRQITVFRNRNLYHVVWWCEIFLLILKVFLMPYKT